MNHNSHFSSIEINLVSLESQGNEKNVDQNKNLRIKGKLIMKNFQLNILSSSIDI